MKKQYLLKLLVVSLVIVLALTAASPFNNVHNKVRVFVDFAPGGQAAVRNALNGAGAEFHYTFDHLNSFVVTLPRQALSGLAKNPNVVGIEEDPLRFPVEAVRSEAGAPAADILSPSGDFVPYGVDAVQARQLWDTDVDGNVDEGAKAGEGVKVCIIDTGYYGGHQDLPDLEPEDGISLVDDNWYEDGYGHGSHVAGTIAAEDNDLGVIGVAPNVSFFIVKYFDNDGLYVRQAHASDLVEAVITCADNGAKVISMSLSGTQSNGHEKRTFDMLYYERDVLSVAAASNDGIEEYHYPASYDSVVSVAAVDESEMKADFSQFNDQVELAAPGVAVMSTIPYIDVSFVTVDDVDYQANPIEYAARGTVSGVFVDGGLCDSTGDWADAVVLCARGDISFLEKVTNVQDSGGVAAVIYNNLEDNFWGTLGDNKDSSEIVAVSLSKADGEYLVANYLGSTATVTNEHIWPTSGYEAWDGTSMATPHVSAVAALLWSEVPEATNAQIREAMQLSAKDLDVVILLVDGVETEVAVPGWDIYYGYGLVQAADALVSLELLVGGGE